MISPFEHPLFRTKVFDLPIPAAKTAFTICTLAMKKLLKCSPHLGGCIYPVIRIVPAAILESLPRGRFSSCKPSGVRFDLAAVFISPAAGYFQHC
jgi:hypothetical protein